MACIQVFSFHEPMFLLLRQYNNVYIFVERYQEKAMECYHDNTVGMWGHAFSLPVLLMVLSKC